MNAWVNTCKIDLNLERPIFGFQPAVVLEKRAPMYINSPTMDTPESMPTPDAGSYYTTATDGTPTIRRHISLAPAAIVEAGMVVNQQAPVRPDSIQIPNPEFVPERQWKQLRQWVHCWFLVAMCANKVIRTYDLIGNGIGLRMALLERTCGGT